MDIVSARGEDHRMSRDEFVKNLLEKSKSNVNFSKTAAAAEGDLMYTKFVPNKSAVDLEFEQALATPLPVPTQSKMMASGGAPVVPMHSHMVDDPSHVVHPNDSMAGLMFSPSWTQADRLEEVPVSQSKGSEYDDDGALVSEHKVIEHLRSHIASLEHQLFSIIEHNQKVTVEEAAQMDVFAALVERQNAGQEAAHEALQATTKQNAWLHNALEVNIRKHGSSAGASSTEENDTATHDGDREPTELHSDDDIEWKDHHNSSTAAPSAGKIHSPPRGELLSTLMGSRASSEGNTISA